MKNKKILNLFTELKKKFLPPLEVAIKRRKRSNPWKIALLTACFPPLFLILAFRQRSLLYLNSFLITAPVYILMRFFTSPSGAVRFSFDWIMDQLIFSPYGPSLIYALLALWFADHLRVFDPKYPNHEFLIDYDIFQSQSERAQRARYERYKNKKNTTNKRNTNESENIKDNNKTYEVSEEWTQISYRKNKNTIKYPKEKSDEFKSSKSSNTKKSFEDIKNRFEDIKKVLNQISEPDAVKRSRKSDWIHQLTEDQRVFYNEKGVKDNETLSDFLKRFFDSKQEKVVQEESLKGNRKRSEPQKAKDDWVTQLTDEQKSFYEKEDNVEGENLSTFLKRYFDYQQQKSKKEKIPTNKSKDIFYRNVGSCKPEELMKMSNNEIYELVKYQLLHLTRGTRKSEAGEVEYLKSLLKELRK